MKKFFIISAISLSALAIYISIALINAPKKSIYPQYYKQAKAMYDQMSQQQRIGELLLPSYVLLQASGTDGGADCSTTFNDPNSTDQQIAAACGLNKIAQYDIGGVLTGGGPLYPGVAPTLENWQKINRIATEIHNSVALPHDILLTGNDAVHGNMHLQGAVMFPHNIGLGVANDPEAMQELGQMVGQDSLAAGFNWVYAPTVAVAQDIRWGRTYESFGWGNPNEPAQNIGPSLARNLAGPYILGIQNIQDNQITGALATVKHFIGDGATQYGLDEGDDQNQYNFSDFWAENGQGYEAAVDADVGSMMVSYSAMDGNGSRMHFGGEWGILNQFINQGVVGTDGKTYRFNGFTVSDWNGATRASYFMRGPQDTHPSLAQIYANSLNAGVNMFMVAQSDSVIPTDPSPNAPVNFTSIDQVVAAFNQAYAQHLFNQQAFENAVIRILEVKLAMQHQQAPANYPGLQAQERGLALKLARESLVLLQNNNATIPVNKNAIQNVVFIGDVNDLGLQNGGWTVNWQGQEGDQYFQGPDALSSGATTLQQGIQNDLAHQNVNYYFVDSQGGNIPADLNPSNTIAVALVSEVPYAEYMGDVANGAIPDHWYAMGAENQYNLYLGMSQNNNLALNFTQAEADAVQNLKAQGVKVITVVYSGRPMILTEHGNQGPLNVSDATIAAFLPGTLGGQALADAIFGIYHFRANGYSNTLNFPWPRNMTDVDTQFQSGYLYPVGYGLSD